MESVRRPRAAHSPMDPGRPRQHVPPTDLAVLRLQQSAGNHATAALLQRALKPAFAQRPVWYVPLHQLAQEYNDLRGAKELWGILPKWAVGDPAQARQAALAKLGEVERWVYDWFRQRENQDRTADPEWAPMRAFLNQIQTERDGLVALALSDGGDPPLANFGQLQAGEQQQVRAIWNELIREKPVGMDLRMGIVIEGAEQAARIRLLADFSRLLETETGRMVVGGLSGDQPRLTVTPAANAKFAASPVNEAYEGLTAGGPPKPTEQFVALTLDGLSVQERKVAINDARVRNPDARGVSLTTAADGTLHFRFNTGTGSNVTVHSGAQDTSDQASSLVLGANDYAIIAPTFINLGHELGHALRSLHGITAKDDAATNAMLAHAFKNVAIGDRKEEFFNIDAIENRIRAQVGLSRRGGHADWSGNELARMFDVAQAINAAADNVQQLAPAQLGQEIAQLRIAADALTNDLRDALERRQARITPPSVDEIRALRTRAATMRQHATNLEQRATAIQQQQQNVVALKPRVSPGPRAVQRFGIDDRQWSQVTAVSHLGAAAYEVTAGDAALVVKKAGSPTLDSGGSAEGPVQEGLGAKLGEIGGLGVTVAKTVIIQTSSVEGRQILTKLKILRPPGPELAAELEVTEAFLVMERAVGQRADKAKAQIVGQSEQDRALLFSRLGRLWAFDALISNTDRFQKTNWGNVIIGPAGSVVGIDQAVGANASGQPGEMAELVGGDVGEQVLKTILKPGERRKLGLELFESLRDAVPPGGTRALPPEFPTLQGEFIRNFELGALEGMDAIAALNPQALVNKKAELPAFTHQAADAYGIAGAQVIHRVIAASHVAIGEQLRGVRAQIAEQGRVTQRVGPYLAAARAMRAQILDHLGGTAGRIVEKWPEVNKWLWGKDSHWNDQRDQLKPLQNFRRNDFAALAPNGVPEESEYLVREQFNAWAIGMEPVWEAGNKLAAYPQDAHDTIKPLAEAVVQAVHAQRGQALFLDQML